jgi:hypothetical protein
MSPRDAATARNLQAELVAIASSLTVEALAALRRAAVAAYLAQQRGADPGLAIIASAVTDTR